MTKFIFCTLLGWKIFGEIRPVNKCVIIVAPHTHWLDFFVALPVRRILNLEINFIGKKELFFFPLNYLLKYLGGSAVYRNSKSKTVDLIADKFNDKKNYRLALSPEGTRKKVDKWKTGFYYIAKKANVPIVSVSIDAKKKEVIFSKPFYPTDNIDKDFAHLKKFYRGVVGIITKNS
ncbi:MAG: 1-acyl-sn-glycerol-3-phosphate acyltransferase [Flavobacteriaceae bacterium]|nr:1-acyl-sn-glycerol-3-phosphate acyltransferase [Flavobacteriaceae bacterium]MBL6684651.1 1-acyl-sn-glycerol-3-phosphate acyltransferase [Flavobacteriaceae bacterium]